MFYTVNDKHTGTIKDTLEPRYSTTCMYNAEGESRLEFCSIFDIDVVLSYNLRLCVFRFSNVSDVKLRLL